MSLSIVKYAMAASLVPIAVAFPTNYMPNSVRAVQGTLPRCSNNSGLPVTHCFIDHGPTTNTVPTSVVDITVPNGHDIIKISTADIAAPSNLNFEQMLGLIAPETHDKSIMEHTIMDRNLEPTRDANGEIIVGGNDGKFTQTEEQRQRLDKEEQKEKDDEDKIEAIEEAKKHGGDDGQFTVDDAQRKELDNKEQKQEEEMEEKKEEASTTYIQQRELKDPARDQGGNLIVGDDDGVFTQTEEQRIKLTEEEQKDRDAEENIKAIEEAMRNVQKTPDGQFTQFEWQRKKLDQKEQKEIDALNKKIAEYKKEMENDKASIT